MVVLLMVGVLIGSLCWCGANACCAVRARVAPGRAAKRPVRAVA